MADSVKAKVVYDRVVVFDKPGSTHYVTFVYKGDVVTVTKGYNFVERDWKDKQFVEIETAKGEKGFMTVHGLTPIR